MHKTESTLSTLPDWPLRMEEGDPPGVLLLLLSPCLPPWPPAASGKPQSPRSRWRTLLKGPYCTGPLRRYNQPNQIKASPIHVMYYVNWTVYVLREFDSTFRWLHSHSIPLQPWLCVWLPPVISQPLPPHPEEFTINQHLTTNANYYPSMYSSNQEINQLHF